MERAKEFARRITELPGGNVVSVVIFGSAVRPGYAVGHAEFNILMIVRDASTAALRPIEPIVADWIKRRDPPPLIFSEEEWRRSTDVFPMEIEDMREAHQLLAGTDPFDGLTTSLDDLRTELEREARGKLLKLRSEYTASAPDGKELTGLLIESVNTFFVLMRGLVRMVGGTPQAEPRELIRQACAAADLDETAFSWVVDKISGNTVRALKAYDEIGARYVEEIEKMAHFVDQYSGRSRAAATKN
jgi:hypothetical protein